MTKSRLAVLALLLLTFLIGGCDPAALSEVPGAVGTSDLDVPSPAELGLDIDDLDPDAPLPLAPDLRSGELKNGLDYYIRRNTEPANRAELWLVVNAGSVLEDEDQLGLAHFLEHMLFEGTRRFSEEEIFDFFELAGMEGGADINAYTTTDETVYYLRFPVDDQEAVETAFDVLEDWAAYATLDPAEVEEERTVILEEERLRMQNASGRLYEQQWPLLLGESRYTERFPIGDMDVIRNAPPETIRRFYETWYRPDLMAVIAVGDFDVDEIETKIVEHFSDLPVPEDVVERPTYTVPDFEEPQYAILTDPELTQTVIEIYQKRDAEELSSLEDYRSMLVGLLFQELLNFRLDEVARQAGSPFVAAAVGEDRLVRPAIYLVAAALVQDEDVLVGTEALLTEIERVRRHGFTDSELDRAKNNVLSFYERLYQDRENLDSTSLAQELVRHHLEGEAVPGITAEFVLAQQLLRTIEVEEVNAIADRFVDAENRTILVTAPTQDEVTLPTEVDLAAVIEAVQAKAIDPYEDVEVADALLAEIPDPVPVVSTETLDAIDVTIVELANGVRVLMKPTDFSEGTVLVHAVSPGGTSLVSEEDYVEAAYVSQIVNQSGAGEFSYSQLIRFLTGPNIGVSPYIADATEGFSGSVVASDLELIFQLIYLFATEPRFDEAALDTLQAQARSALRNRQRSPDAIVQDALTEILYGDTVRRGVPPLAEFEQFDLERAEAIYRERFADFSDFTFIMVGNFEIDEATELAQIYLGNLPSLDREETWRDVLPDPPDDAVEEAVFAGVEENSLSRLLFTDVTELTPEEELHLAFLGQILNDRIGRELRTERGSVYASGAWISTSDRPDPRYFVTLAFGSDPERAQELLDVVFGFIEDLKTEGPTEDEMTKARNQLLRNREEELEQNGFWVSVLEECALDAESDPTEILDFAERVDAVTAADVQQAAQKFLPSDQYIEIVLYPDEFEPVQE